MPWTETTRPHYERRCPRYVSDLTDAEWALIAPLMPAPNRIGRPRKTDLREVVNALLYMASSGGAWRLLPKDFPPFSTVQKYFWRWRDEGLLRALNNELVMAVREREISEHRDSVFSTACALAIDAVSAFRRTEFQSISTSALIRLDLSPAQRGISSNAPARLVR